MTNFPLFFFNFRGNIKMHVEVFFHLTHGGTVEKKKNCIFFWSKISIAISFFLIHILKLYHGRYLNLCSLYPVLLPKQTHRLCTTVLVMHFISSGMLHRFCLSVVFLLMLVFELSSNFY